MSEDRTGLMEELARAVERDPADPDFPVLAELLRRASRLDEAEDVVTEGLLAAPESLTGRCVMLLILADRGRQDDLRGRLEAWVDEVVRERVPPGHATLEDEPPLPTPLSDSELERAFADAATETESMVTPDTIAEEAALRIDGEAEADGLIEQSSPFATRTMAELLERQGDAAGAARIRALLTTAPEEESAPEPSPPAPARPGRVLSTLERWLSNARRLHA